MPLDDYHIPLEFEPPFPFEMIHYEYIGIFNMLMSARPGAFN